MHVDANSEVNIDLANGRIPTALPFDVNFFLKANVPAGTRRVMVKKGEKSDHARGECTPTVDLTREGEGVPSAGTEPFVRVLVPRLEVTRDYCFEFVVDRVRSEAESKKIIAALRGPLLSLYQTSDVPEVAAGLAPFRTEVIKAVERAILPPTRFVPISGSYLDLSTPFASLGERQLFEAPFLTVLQARQRITTYLQRRAEPLFAPLAPPTLTTTATAAEVAAELARVAQEVTDNPALAPDLRAIVGDLIEAQTLLDNLIASVDAVAASLDARLVDEYRLLATTTASYEGRFYAYVSADLGAGFAPETDDFFQYLGANIYTRPVNKKALLNGLDLRRRLAFTVGVGEALEGDTLSGLFGDRPLLLGAGLRVTSHFRLSAGLQVFYEDDPDPLVSGKDLAVTPYVGGSIDFDLANAFKNFFTPLFGS